MKKMLFLSLTLGLMTLSCSKSGGEDNEPAADAYLNTKAGSTWLYQDQDNTTPATPPEEYLLTSTNRDTTAAGKTYHIYSDNTGGNVYQGKNGNDYSAFEALPDELGGSLVDNIYLKTDVAVNANWIQTYNVTVVGLPLSVNVNNKIIAKGLNKTVLSNSYSNVIQVKTAISLSGTAAAFVSIGTDINSYYAPNVGLIQRDAIVDYTITGTPPASFNNTTRLKTAVLL